MYTVPMVDSVKDARARRILKSGRPFEKFTEDSIIWANGREKKQM